MTERVRDDILNGRYRKGSTLPAERELAAELGVNRTSLKHALLGLEQLGLIAIRHGIGSVVLDRDRSAGAELLSHLVFRKDGVDLQMLSDLLEARRLLGGFLSRLAARRRSEAHVEALNELASSLDPERGPTPPDRAQAIELDFFHAIVVATGNRALVFLANSLFAVYRTQLRVFEDAFAEQGFVHSALSRVADFIAAGDADGAEEATLAYLHENGDRMLRASPPHGGTHR